MELKILHILQGIHHPVLDKIMVIISSLGNAGIIWIIFTILLLCFPKYRRCGITMAAALIIDVVICNLILKNLVARSRPCWVDQTISLLIDNPKDYSFPSGHTAAAFAAVIPFLYYHKREGIAALIFALTLAFSRMYLFVHYPTDILGGIIVGVAAGTAAIAIMKNRYKNKKYSKPNSPQQTDKTSDSST